MRHFYFRLIFGIVWLVAAVVSVNPFFAVLGIMFLWSAYSIRKKEEGKDNDRKHNG